jgi:hypothetical protein
MSIAQGCPKKRKRENENLLKEFVNNNSQLHIKYNNIWKNIKIVKDKMIERKVEEVIDFVELS